MVRYLIAVAVLAAGAASAQDWNLRDTDAVMSQAETTDRLVGETITFYDEGKSQYYEDGRYSYTYESGQSAYGYYRIMPEGVVCIDYINGFERCDRFVVSGQRLVLLTETGERFPVRPQ